MRVSISKCRDKQQYIENVGKKRRTSNDYNNDLGFIAIKCLLISYIHCF